MVDASSLLGERIASLEAKIADLGSREDHASEERQRNSEILSSLRNEVKAVSSQQQLISSRIEAIGQMAQVAKDFVAAAREIPTRADFSALKDESHATNIRLTELRTEFRLAKEARDASVTRMWAVITGALATGVSSFIGLIMTWASKH